MINSSLVNKVEQSLSRSDAPSYSKQDAFTLEFTSGIQRHEIKRYLKSVTSLVCDELTFEKKKLSNFKISNYDNIRRHFRNISLCQLREQSSTCWHLIRCFEQKRDFLGGPRSCIWGIKRLFHFTSCCDLVKWLTDIRQAQQFTQMNIFERTAFDVTLRQIRKHHNVCMQVCLRLKQFLQYTISCNFQNAYPKLRLFKHRWIM